ncbi:MAG: polysaccharide deacetylase family protein [Verrucomicrobiota bacterium]
MSPFLFSVDLEEFTPAQPGADFRRTALPKLTEGYLELLRRHQARATFFVVGEVAEQFPSLVREIAAEGHELACHTHTHRPLNRHTPESFRDDLARNLDAVRACTACPVTGFRAPVLSLTEKTRWAYPILAEAGIRYSSSVLPAPNPLHGWPGFGLLPQCIDGVLELPITLAKFAGAELPIGAGTYFRCLPFGAIRRRFRDCAAKGIPVVGYFHPYDIDTHQQWVMNDGVRGNPALNFLLYLNRSKTIKRLDALLQEGFHILPYDAHLFSNPL